MRILWRRTVLLLISASFISSMASAEDRSAQAQVEDWSRALKETPRLAVRFRCVQLNKVFDSEVETSGAFYRDEQGNWSMSVGPDFDSPVSALSPTNRDSRQRPAAPPLTFISHGENLYILADSTKSVVSMRWQPVSALDPDNVEWSQGWYGFAPFGSACGQGMFDAMHLFPLLFAESSEIGWYEAARMPLETNNCIRLIRRPGTSQRDISTVDAVFRSGERLPFAIRRFGRTGTLEVRFYIESMRSGSEAIIPPDAFLVSVPTNGQ